MLDGELFKEVLLPRKAKQLAARLSKVLAPLFSPPSHECGNEQFECWGESQELCENRRFRFIGIFEAALKLKVATVTTDQQYEFVTFPPGTTSMAAAEDAPSRDFNVSGSFRGSMGDNCCLLSTLNVYDAAASSPRDPFADALVQPHNFISKEVQRRPSALLHSRNIVIPRPELEPGSSTLKSAENVPSNIAAFERERQKKRPPMTSCQDTLDQAIYLDENHYALRARLLRSTSGTLSQETSVSHTGTDLSHPVMQTQTETRDETRRAHSEDDDCSLTELMAIDDPETDQDNARYDQQIGNSKPHKRIHLDAAATHQQRQTDKTARSAIQRDLDLTVYRNEIHDMPFQENMIKYTKQQAVRLSTALAPLSIDPSQNPVFQTLGEDQGVWTDLLSCLQRIFTSDLMRNAQTVPSQKLHKLVLGPIGTLDAEHTTGHPKDRNPMDPSLPFQCEKCGREFGYICNLNAHKKGGKSPRPNIL
jgi:hypothetical protein